MKIDIYNLKARIYPSFIVLLPLLFIAIFYITNIQEYFHYITAFTSIGLFSYLLSQLGRDKGKLKEPELYELWNGKPTTQILRHSNTIIDQLTKDRYHKILSEKIGNIYIPTKEEEIIDKIKADTIYESCTNYLIAKTRDTEKYNLLFKENISYGFRRNLWGMKNWGISILLITLILHFLIATKVLNNFSLKPTKDVYLYLLLLLDLIFWLFIVNPNWIKTVAFEYAKRLYETLND